MVYLPLCEVTDTPFHIQGDDIIVAINSYISVICPQLQSESSNDFIQHV